MVSEGFPAWAESLHYSGLQLRSLERIDLLSFEMCRRKQVLKFESRRSLFAFPPLVPTRLEVSFGMLLGCFAADRTDLCGWLWVGLAFQFGVAS
jgi:hypothetical protein